MASTFRRSRFGHCLLSATLIGACSAARAINVDSELQARQAVAFWGGYTLAHSGTTCPSNTYECTGTDVTNEYDNMYACCPVGTYCWNNGPTYCCPDANDCLAKLATEQVCADTSWTLWEGPYPHGPFCCQEGESPINDPNAPFGECWSSGLPVVATEIASSIPQVAVTFLPFTATGHGAAATNTVAHASTTTSPSPSSTASAVSSVVTSASKVILSKTAIIGIAVGGGVFLILFLLGVGCCCWKKCCCKKRRRPQQNSYSQSYEPYRQIDAPQQGGQGNTFQKMEMQVLGGYVDEFAHR